MSEAEAPRRTSLVVEADAPGEFRHRLLSVVVSRVDVKARWALVAASGNALALSVVFDAYRRHGRAVCMVGAAEQAGVLRISDRHSPAWSGVGAEYPTPEPPTEPFLPLG